MNDLKQQMLNTMDLIRFLWCLAEFIRNRDKIQIKIRLNCEQWNKRKTRQYLILKLFVCCFTMLLSHPHLYIYTNIRWCSAVTNTPPNKAKRNQRSLYQQHSTTKWRKKQRIKCFVNILMRMHVPCGCHPLDGERAWFSVDENEFRIKCAFGLNYLVSSTFKLPCNSWGYHTHASCNRTTKNENKKHLNCFIGNDEHRLTTILSTYQ